MIKYSPIYTPSQIKRGEVFSAWQYPRQAFGDLIDPVLNIDWFEMRGPTFPAHPHAGFSAVTYLFEDSPNGFVNRDSEGEEHAIRPGGLHWSRAARGMVHEETPVADAGAVRGLQIFVNLPAVHQADAARGYPVTAEQVAVDLGKGIRRRTAVNGTTLGSAVAALPAPVRIEEVAISAHASWRLDLPAAWGGILVVLDGAVSLEGDRSLMSPEAIGFAADAYSSIAVTSGDAEARLAVVIGERLQQPVFAHGPLMLASAEALATSRGFVATLSIPNPEAVD